MCSNILKPRLHRWELITLLGIAVILLAGLWLEREQSELAESVLRLHVLANSDSEADQTLKLKVRDRVLAEAEAIVPDNATVEETTETLANNLHLLAQAGAEVVSEEGYNYPVSASLEQAWFPTKEYEEFSLPAGQYQALRIVIGEGEGQNWWCVVFPPLCLGAASESVQEVALNSGVNEQQVSLMTGDSEGYVIKFKAMELWDKLKTALS